MKIKKLISEFDNKYPDIAKKIKEDIAYQEGKMILEARLKIGMTQEVLAKKMGTKQPAIARLERGASFPSLRMLDRMAKKVFKTYLKPARFAFLDEAEEAFKITNNSAGHNLVASSWLDNQYLGYGVQFKLTTQNYDQK